MEKTKHRRLNVSQYEHLPIYKKAMDLAVYVETIVRGFPRYHKYTIGSEMRALSHKILVLVVRASPGGVTTSTFTINLHSGGDVYIASGSISANMGMAYVFDYATATITGVRCYTLVASSVATTSFNIMVSTDIGGSTGVGNYLFTSSVTVSTNLTYRSMYSPWTVPDTTFGSQGVVPMAISLQTIAVPASGTLPSEYGCVIKYWRRLD